MIKINTIGNKYELSMGNNKVVIDSFGAKVLAFYQGNDNRLYYSSDDISHSGIPLCFPNFGPLANNEFCYNGKTYPIKQHGFVRNMNFDFVSKTDNTLVLELKSNSETLLQYPLEFSFRVSFILAKDEIKICFIWHNKSNKKAPISPGVHPYFSVYDREGVVLQTNSLSYNLSADFSEIEKVIGSEFLDAASQSSFIIKGAPDINLINHNSENTSIMLGDNKSVNLKYSSLDFNRLTVWRKNASDDYICVEPANAQNKINNNPLLIDGGGIWESIVKIKFN